MTLPPQRTRGHDDARTPGTRRGRRGRLIAAIAGIAVVALAATGCSIQVRSQPDPSIGKDTMLINADHGNPLFDRNFNPYIANARTASKWMYEPLIEVNPLDGKRNPWLASSWTQPDAKTIDMTIRSGVEWSDGSAFTAKDVVFTFDLLKKFPAMDVKGAWQHIDTIDRKGDHVVFHLKSEDVPSLTIIGQTYILGEQHWGGVKDPTTWRDPNPVGTGPFVLGNYTDQQYSMDKNKRYWQADKIAIKHLILPATNTQLDTVTRGYDWAYSFISDVEGTWGAASKTNTYWFPPGGVIGLIPNLTKAPYNDVNVRRGISLALNRDDIAETATEGNLKAAAQTGLILPNQERYVNDDIPDKGVVTQDTKAALASFAKSGYETQGGKLVKDGKQLEIKIMTANGYSDWLRAAQEVQRNLTAIGIKVTIQAPQPAGYQQNINNGQFDMAMGGMGNGDVYQAFNSLLSSDFYQPVGKSTVNNYERYRNADTQKLLDEYKATTDTARQQEILDQLQEVVYDDLPVIGMYYGGLWGLFNTSKFVGWPSADDPYMAPQNYDSAPLLIFSKLRLRDSAAGKKILEEQKTQGTNQ
ncbi:ABC transporter substrate-binding protein [Curtobacterium pusillum]|uniref:Peptide/nickel transport system substrate-binding protein n=1 Tax=Curtobacterium pusillum TaxID=69373 RepID=A0AAW3T3V7_9MICO|nr:ABC transporter substrate-binding protein [Curtobacterium pusillum]MBA8989709.1 peptide/nickel transport system substrate-binding protein [Curtobacterium pusillum]GLK32083.1 peptide ABC transporter substrate-binding protein [Curtobacterium pusillum]